VIGLNGVDPTLAGYVRQAAAIVKRDYPGVSLKVTSGYRSPAYQASLRARWDSGDRGGLVTRPAIDSKHSSGRAVDLVFAIGGRAIPASATPIEAFQWLADLFAPVGVRWGGQRDRVHFEI
jgi:D-alanyl-D-alanine dipeptidase